MLATLLTIFDCVFLSKSIVIKSFVIRFYAWYGGLETHRLCWFDFYFSSCAFFRKISWNRRDLEEVIYTILTVKSSSIIIRLPTWKCRFHIMVGIPYTWRTWFCPFSPPCHSFSAFVVSVTNVGNAFSIYLFPLAISIECGQCPLQWAINSSMALPLKHWK